MLLGLYLQPEVQLHIHIWVPEEGAVSQKNKCCAHLHSELDQGAANPDDARMDNLISTGHEPEQPAPGKFTKAILSSPTRQI